tara:strand:- start:6756 stop:7451 length:696 start_codon:yes stop_codon:yes gene_type:complete
MSKDIVNFGGGQLPSIQDLAATLSKVTARPESGVDTAFMQFDGTGHWVFGVDKDMPEEGSQWAINPYSFMHGYIAWASTRGLPPLKEHMVPLNDPLPDIGPAPEGTGDNGWEHQLGFSVRCLSGAYEGTHATYAAATKGCHDLVAEIGAEISARVAKHPDTPVPAVELLHEQWYSHPKHGKTWVPKVKFVDWLSMVGTAASDDELDDELDDLDAGPAAQDETPRRRRHRAA